MILSDEMSVKLGGEKATLEEKQQLFTRKFFDFVHILSQTNGYNDPRDIDIILEKTELDNATFENDMGYIEFFKLYENNFEIILYFLSEILKNITKVNDEDIFKWLVKLLNVFNRHITGYKYNKKNKEFERIIDEANTKVIGTNQKFIKENENTRNLIEYNKCVNEFLTVKNGTNPDFYYDSLGRMKNVLERTIGSRLKQNGKGVRLSQKKTILNKIYKDTKRDIGTQEKTLKFIIEKIHHDQDKKEVPTPYNFNLSEYKYWWLEMNTLIYLVNSNKD